MKMKTVLIPAFASIKVLRKIFCDIHNSSIDSFCIQRPKFNQIIPIDFYKCHQSIFLSDLYSLSKYQENKWSYTWHFKKKLMNTDEIKLEYLQHYRNNNNSIFSIRGYDLSALNITLELLTAKIIKCKESKNIIGIAINHPTPAHLAAIIEYAFSANQVSKLVPILELFNIEVYTDFLCVDLNHQILSPNPPLTINSSIINRLKYGWSLCIITNGLNKNIISDLIVSFSKQIYINKEVLICGDFPIGDKYSVDIRLINEPINSGDDCRAWITKKKNLFTAYAKYTNLLILHDRIKITDDWSLDEVSKEIDSSEVLVFPVYRDNTKDRRINDWESMVGSLSVPDRLKLIPLAYEQIPEKPNIYGAAFAIKTDLFQKLPLNEMLYWSEAEDIHYTEVLNLLGIKPSLSKYSLLSPYSRSRGMSKSRLKLLTSQLLMNLYSGWIKCFIQDLRTFVKV